MGPAGGTLLLYQFFSPSSLLPLFWLNPVGSHAPACVAWSGALGCAPAGRWAPSLPGGPRSSVGWGCVFWRGCFRWACVWFVPCGWFWWCLAVFVCGALLVSLGARPRLCGFVGCVRCWFGVLACVCGGPGPAPPRLLLVLPGAWPVGGRLCSCGGLPVVRRAGCPGRFLCSWLSPLAGGFGSCTKGVVLPPFPPPPLPPLCCFRGGGGEDEEVGCRNIGRDGRG